MNLTFFLGNAESNRYNEEVFKNSLKFAILGQVRRLMRQKDGNLDEILFSAEFSTGGFWGGSQGSLLPEEAAVDQGTISKDHFGRGVMYLAMILQYLELDFRLQWHITEETTV